MKAYKVSILTIVNAFLLITLSQGLSTRKSFLSQSSAALLSVIVVPVPSEASPYCAAGVGENCLELSEGNDYIKALQQKSAENKETNAKVCALLVMVVYVVYWLVGFLGSILE